jgi:hypothetical protein
MPVTHRNKALALHVVHDRKERIDKRPMLLAFGKVADRIAKGNEQPMQLLITIYAASLRASACNSSSAATRQITSASVATWYVVPRIVTLIALAPFDCRDRSWPQSRSKLRHT